MKQNHTGEQLERRICAAICHGRGLKARDIAKQLDLDRTTVNRVLYGSSLLQELCYQDPDFRWHGVIRQERPHAGLFEFSGYYSLVSEFLALTDCQGDDRQESYSSAGNCQADEQTVITHQV